MHAQAAPFSKKQIFFNLTIFFILWNNHILTKVITFSEITSKINTVLDTFPLQIANCFKLRMLRPLHYRDLVPLVLALFSFCLGYTQVSAAILCMELSLSASYNSVFQLILLPRPLCLDLDRKYTLYLQNPTPLWITRVYSEFLDSHLWRAKNQNFKNRILVVLDWGSFNENFYIDRYITKCFGVN